MGWNYPEISLEEMVKLVKGFVDILILASGYQSSGLLAHWDARNIIKAFQWGLFFENVLSFLKSSVLFRDSVKDLDAALAEMISDPSFPQGLSHISSATLSRGRDLVLEHFIGNLPLSDGYLRAFLTATIEMDLSELSQVEHGCLNAYLNKLMLLDASVHLLADKRGSIKDSSLSSLDDSTTMMIDQSKGDDFTKQTVKELLKRQSAVSCISTAESGLHVLSNIIRHGSLIDNLLKDQISRDKERALPIEGNAEQLVDVSTWHQWKSRNLLYFLDKRTVRLVSGAGLIFSASKIQWMLVFGQLNISAEGNDDDWIEKIEILLLGCIASRWSCLIRHFMSVSYNPLSISLQFRGLCNLLMRTSESFDCEEKKLNSEEYGIIEHLTELLGDQLHCLWKFSPALVAAAIPTGSPLFKLYLSELGTQLKVDSSAISVFFLADAAAQSKIKGCTQSVTSMREYGAFTSFMFVPTI